MTLIEAVLTYTGQPVRHKYTGFVGIAVAVTVAEKHGIGLMVEIELTYISPPDLLHLVHIVERITYPIREVDLIRSLDDHRSKIDESD